MPRRPAEATRFRSVGRSAGMIAAVLLTASLCALTQAVPAAAQIPFVPCADSNEFACAHLDVALDPGVPQAGTISLAIRRHRAPVGDARSAVIALAGGPGQAALPFAEQFTSLLGPILDTRDLIVFDQRGTGHSHPLSCHRFEAALVSSTPGPAVAECAAQLGPTRSLYMTADSVADIEAIRLAGGYEKLVLYGTSYGTKLAEEYAQAYPGQVEALVLDSVVPPNGPDPLNGATFAAVPRILRQLCARGGCAHITTNPLGDLDALVERLGGRGTRGHWVDGRGRAHTIAISSAALIEALVQGDLEPTLRAELPAAVRSAARGDMAALARLLQHARSAEREAESPGESFDTPLYFATTCEEGLFPWNRSASPRTRLAEAESRIRLLSPRSIEPFRPADVLDLSDMPSCAYWPYAAPARLALVAPFPAVPTLILSGADDLRTPTANAAEVAAQIPGSRLLVVPYVGHSVLGTDPSNCSRNALQALFTSGRIRPCTSGPAPALLRPIPLPPPRLADVAPARGNRGRPGRTLEAVLQTLGDFEYQVALQLLAQFEEQAGASSLTTISAVRVGGLRAGWGELAGGKLRLDDYSYVPGVTVSGQITAERVNLRVGGYAAARGMLLADPEASGSRRMLAGLLEGHEVHLASATPRAAAARAALAALRSTSSLHDHGAATRARLLAASARLRALIDISG